MGHIRETVYVHAPIDRVWKFATDPARFAEWQTNVLEIKDVVGLPGEVGSSYAAIYRALGRKIEARAKVTKAESPRFLEEKGHMPGTGEYTATTVLESTPDGGTAVTFTMDYTMGASFIAGLADRFLFERSIERDIRHSNENLKELIEAETPVAVS